MPEHKAGLGARFALLKNYALNFTGYYIGSRFRINDVNNALPKIKSYVTADLGLSYSRNDFTISASINNLFDKKYYELATYGAFSGNKLYYPAPARNFNLKLDYRF